MSLNDFIVTTYRRAWRDDYLEEDVQSDKRWNFILHCEEWISGRTGMSLTELRRGRNR